MIIEQTLQSGVQESFVSIIRIYNKKLTKPMEFFPFFWKFDENSCLKTSFTVHSFSILHRERNLVTYLEPLEFS